MPNLVCLPRLCVAFHGECFGTKAVWGGKDPLEIFVAFEDGLPFDDFPREKSRIYSSYVHVHFGPEVEQKRWREDKRILKNSPTHRKKSSTKQQTHRQCLTVRRQTSSSCSTHILQHTLSISEGMSFDERHGHGSQCSACMYKTKDESIFSLSFWGIACYGRCLRKGLGHLGWNPNIGMIIPQLSCWCLVHIYPPKIVQKYW